MLNADEHSHSPHHYDRLDDHRVPAEASTGEMIGTFHDDVSVQVRGCQHSQQNGSDQSQEELSRLECFEKALPNSNSGSSAAVVPGTQVTRSSADFDEQCRDSTPGYQTTGLPSWEQHCTAAGTNNATSFLAPNPRPTHIESNTSQRTQDTSSDIHSAPTTSTGTRRSFPILSKPTSSLTSSATNQLETSTSIAPATVATYTTTSSSVQSNRADSSSVAGENSKGALTNDTVSTQDQTGGASLSSWRQSERTYLPLLPRKVVPAANGTNNGTCETSSEEFNGTSSRDFAGGKRKGPSTPSLMHCEEDGLATVADVQGGGFMIAPGVSRTFEDEQTHKKQQQLWKRDSLPLGLRNKKMRPTDCLLFAATLLEEESRASVAATMRNPKTAAVPFQKSQVNTRIDNTYTVNGTNEVSVAAEPAAGQTVASSAAITRFSPDSPTAMTLSTSQNDGPISQQPHSSLSNDGNQLSLEDKDQILSSDLDGKHDVVTEPKDVDVLCGRGGKVNKHHGNIVYRRVVDYNKQFYQSVHKRNRILVSQSIVEAIRNHGGRFLIMGQKGKTWIPIDFKKAVQKTSQALREFKKADGEEGTSDRD